MTGAPPPLPASGASGDADASDDVVDARGLRCPLPVIRLAAAARDLAPGARLTVWSTDPAARLDVPAWARMRGHAVVGEERLPGQGEAEAWAITVEIGG
ncbi:sulfurtransferase TusA family protein [Cellulosimicrobium cellulans]|uniref:sulfurtransferase TusA family protein n=1 Tax=Cellulosimicrobium cellulans TaxID=1710 RepID=UPI001FD3BEA0|nr:sulfurtransferase TusA family protein [Cellulosimicrobium cellulans]